MNIMATFQLLLAYHLLRTQCHLRLVSLLYLLQMLSPQAMSRKIPTPGQSLRDDVEMRLEIHGNPVRTEVLQRNSPPVDREECWANQHRGLHPESTVYPRKDRHSQQQTDHGHLADTEVRHRDLITTFSLQTMMTLLSQSGGRALLPMVRKTVLV